MTAPIFVDTNVLIYALDEANPKKLQAARTWRAELWKSRRGRVSYQVLQEFYVKVTRSGLAGSPPMCATPTSRQACWLCVQHITSG